MFTSKLEKLEARLRHLQRLVPDIDAVALVSSDGLSMASSLPRNMDEDRIAAMGATLLGVGKKMVEELERGEFQLAFLKGDSGNIIVTGVGQEAVLVALTTKEAKLGLVLLELKRAVADLEKML